MLDSRMYAVVQSIPMEPAETPPRLRGLQDRVHGLRMVRWLGRLRLSMTGQGSDSVSRRNGGKPEHNGDASTGKSAPGKPSTSESSPAGDSELRVFIDNAVRSAIKRVDDADPLGKNKQGILPNLLIGTQVSYDSACWSPDPRARAPIGSPERDAWEADPNPITHLDKDVQQVYLFLDGIDAETGFTDD